MRGKIAAMSKARKALLIVCALLLTVSMSLLMAFTFRDASADDGVLPGNTAEYTFENDAAFPWTWDKATNTWTRHHSGSVNEMTRHSKLTLKVTSDGDVAFKYMIHSKNEEGDYLKVSKNGEDLNTTDYTAAEYAEVKMTELKTDDTLTFEFYLSSYNGGFDYYVSIRGLDNASLLSQTYEVKATAEGDGTVAVGDEAYQAEATKQVPFGESVVLKAKANDGKTFLGWKKGAEYVSTSKELTVDVDAIMAAQEYTAVFVDPTYQQESMSGWTGNHEKYTASVVKAATNTLTIEFVDEQYITFDFKFNFVKKSGLTFEITIDGKTAYEAKSALTITTQMEYSEVLHVAGGGRHVAVFSLTIGSYTTPPSGASATLENLAFQKSVAMQNITLDWEERLGDVWIVEGYNETSDYFIKTNGHQVTEKTLNLPVGMTVSFYAFPKDGAKSTVTSGNTHGVFSGYYNGKDSLTDAKTYSGKVGTDVFSAGKTLEVRFLEYVPAPEIELTKTIGIEQERGISVQNGSVIDVPDGGNNNLVFQVSKYKTKVEKLTATVGGEDVPITEENQTDQYFGLVLNNVTERSEIVITLDYGDGYYADPITLQLNITTPKGLQDVVFEGAQVTVENFDGEYFPWFYDAQMSTDGFTYTSGISYGASAIGRFQDPKDGIWKEPFTYLKFTVTGSGSFSFDFYLDGGLYSSSTPTSWAGYSLTEPAWGYGNWENKFQLAYGNNTVGTKEASHVDAVIAADGDNGDATVTRIQDGQNWFSCSIPIAAPEQQATTIYIIHQFKNSSNKTYYPLNQMSVRNVKFFSGSKKVEWGVQDGSGADATGNGTITATVDGKAQTSGAQEGIPAGSLIKFTAKPEAGKQLYAWVDGNGKVLSYEDEFTYPLAGEDTKIYAVIDDKDNFAARIGGRLYKTIDAAATAAQDGDKIILLKNTATSESFEIKKGVSLILPIDGREAYYALGNSSNAANTISWAGGTYATPVVTLTVNEGAVITVNGSLYVGGVLHYPDQSAQGHTSGKYTQLILNGSITVGEGGLMDVYGRVTGEGGITVKSGGVLYQPFLILDYAGGTNTEGLFNLNQTPFKRYAMINIQCGKGYTIEYGGELYGHASLYFLSSVTTLDTQFISYVGTVKVNGTDKKGTTTLINLKNGAKATGIYKDEKFVTSTGGNTANIGHTELTITGGATAGYMDFLGLVQTDDVAFSIPYNYSLVLQNGEYEMNYDYKLMPGASLTVEKGATLNLNAKFYVYDGLVQSKMSGKGYPTAEELKTAKYATNANFIVNGTLNINGTFLGVIQTTNTESGKDAATIVVGAKADVGAENGKIVDGGVTSYDCNYMEYASTARIWVKTGEKTGKFHTLEAGKTYVSNYQKGDTFDLPAISVTYEANDYGSSSAMRAHKDHSGGQNYATGTLEAVTGLTGSWMEEHGTNHVYEWTPLSEEETPTAEDPVKSVTRDCTVLGCSEEGEKHLLYNFGTLGSQVYDGKEVSAERLVSLFKAKYAKLPADVEVTCGVAETVKGVKSYTVTVKLENAAFYIDNELKSEATFTFEITAKPIEVTILNQEAVYSGNEPSVLQEMGPGKGYTVANQAICDGDTLGILIEKAAGVKANSYNLTAKELSGAQYSNGNYAIRFVYTAEGHSTFEIKKATLTVTPDNFSSPEGEEPIKDFTAKITGYVNGEQDSLEAGILSKLTFTCEVTKESKKGTYDISVDFTGTLDNYNVDCSAMGTYTVTDPLFSGVSFDNVTVTYDGEQHTISVKGLEGLTEGKVTYDVANTQKNVGTYKVKATVTAKDGTGATYEQEFNATLTIEPRTVKVELLPQEKIYDGEAASASSEAETAWKLATDSAALGTGDTLAVLGVNITVINPTKNVGKYALHVTANQDGNYTVTCANDNAELYEIKQKAVTLEIGSGTSVYGEAIDLATVNVTVPTLCGQDKLSFEIYREEGTDVKEGGYAINGRLTDGQGSANANYAVTFTPGKWTVTPKPVTVVIENKTAVYSGAEPAAPTGWHLKEGFELVNKEDDLKITLTKETGVNVKEGGYAITGVSANGNYTVTFENGTYTITKKTIEITTLTAAGIVQDDGFYTLHFTGDDVELTAHAYDGSKHIEVKIVLSPAKVRDLGSYTVTATVDDINYSGSNTFTVVVISAEGYSSQALVDALSALEEVAEGLDANALTVDDYAKLKQIYKHIAAARTAMAELSEAEQALAEKQLAPYEAFVDAWEEEPDAAVVETAEEVAQAPIAGLFAAGALLTTLAAALFVGGKRI